MQEGRNTTRQLEKPQKIKPIQTSSFKALGKNCSCNLFMDNEQLQLVSSLCLLCWTEVLLNPWWTLHVAQSSRIFHFWWLPVLYVSTCLIFYERSAFKEKYTSLVAYKKLLHVCPWDYIGFLKNNWLRKTCFIQDI